ncbi:hypothetical protein FACS1894200_04040 [Spirochaetia bacterium]|nr:hypothetical protein FACS1894200_04040 [Spirochaetia bacterium]
MKDTYSKRRIVIVDGMGGGIGVQLISKIRALPDLESKNIEIIALGVNAVATERMVRAGAHRGASGENAIKVTVPQADFILGPIGIVIINSMMGEISAGIAQAVLSAPGKRILLPLQNEHFQLAGLEQVSLSRATDKAIEALLEQLEG